MFDRDGTLIRDPEDERVESVDDVELFPDTIESMKRLAEAGYGIVLITNQAGIAESKITEAEFDEINDHFIRLLEPTGVVVATTYMCPHGPDDDCFCRKPEPKMLLQAIEDFEIDSEQTFYIGDRHSDILAGQSAGVRTILVETANEPQEAPEADFIAKSLTEVVDIVLK